MHSPTLNRFDALTIRTASVADRRFDLHVMLPIAAMIVVLCALLLGVVCWTAWERDRSALDASRRVVEGAIGSRRETLADQVTDYVIWNNAFRFLHEEAIDPGWADDNVGFWVFQSLHIELSFVVRPDDTVAYAMRMGQRAAERVGREVPAGLRELVDRARSDRPKRGVTAFVLIDGRPAVAGAGIIRPEHDPPPADPSLLLFVDLIDRSFLERLTHHFGLIDLRWQTAGEEPLPGRLALHTSDGMALGTLAWRIDLPGSIMLRRIMPTLAAVVLAIGLATILVLRHARATACLLRAAEARVVHDALTGLPNRLLFHDRVERALAAVRREGGSVAILYLDMDGFKAVNDTGGHEAGDQVLIETARRLLGVLREADTVARLGGDEFAILQQGGDQPEAAEALCRRLLAALEAPFAIGERQFRLGASIGVAIAPDDGIDPALLLRCADLALYRAKAAGRGTFRSYHEDEAPAGRCPSGGSVELATPAG